MDYPAEHLDELNRRYRQPEVEVVPAIGDLADDARRRIEEIANRAVVESVRSDTEEILERRRHAQAA